MICSDLPSAGLNRFRFNGSASCVSAKRHPEVSRTIGASPCPCKAKALTNREGGAHVDQQLWTFVSCDYLGREPRAGAGGDGGRDYGEIEKTFRPGHADITYWQKYGIRDPRGGGRSSARETAARVAAGGVAREVLKALAPELRITGYMVQMGELALDRSRFDAAAIERNPFWLPDAGAVPEWEAYLSKIRKQKDSVGAAVEVVISGAPAGLGAPVYGKLDTDLAAAMMSINAVKGVEIGEGMAAAGLRGTDNADEIFMGETGPKYSSNHAGGILGGISTGQDIIVRFAVKPTSSILTPRRSITKTGEAIEVVTKGRHDPCVGIRAVPVGEAMAALVLLDHLLLHRGQVGEGPRGQIG